MRRLSQARDAVVALPPPSRARLFSARSASQAVAQDRRPGQGPRPGGCAGARARAAGAAPGPPSPPSGPPGKPAPAAPASGCRGAGRVLAEASTGRAALDDAPFSSPPAGACSARRDFLGRDYGARLPTGSQPPRLATGRGRQGGACRSRRARLRPRENAAARHGSRPAGSGARIWCRLAPGRDVRLPPKSARGLASSACMLDAGLADIEAGSPA